MRREKTVGVSFREKNAEPLFELQTEKISKSCR